MLVAKKRRERRERKVERVSLRVQGSGGCDGAALSRY